MFFIVNHKNSIIAADKDFLDFMGIEDILSAAMLMDKGAISIDNSRKILFYANKNSSYTKIPLQTFFGQSHLYKLSHVTSTTSDNVADDSAIENVVIDTVVPDLFPSDHLESTSPTQKELATVDDTTLTATDSTFEDALDDEVLEMLQPTESGESLLQEEEITIGDTAASSGDLSTANEILESFGSTEPSDLSFGQHETVTQTEEVLLDDETLEMLHSAELDDESPAQKETPMEEIPIKEEAPENSGEALFEISPLADTELPGISLLDNTQDQTDASQDDDGSMPDEEALYTLADTTDDDDLDDALFEIMDEPSAPDMVNDAPELSIDSDILSLIEDEDITLVSDEGEESGILSLMDEDSDLSLPVPTIEESSDQEILTDITANTAQPEETLETFDVEKAAKNMGVSNEEYQLFLDDFLKESSNLNDPDSASLKETIDTLKDASQLLYLPHLITKLDEIETATPEMRRGLIENYLTMTQQLNRVQSVEEDDTDAILPMLEDEDESLEMPKTEEEIPGITEPILSADEDTLEAISLDEVVEISFDFLLKEAAEELSLPVSLVEEFVLDFIDQGKEETPNLQKAYQAKDLDTVQKTAHMLKGASSNLRIVPIAETLYNLQMNSELERIPELVRTFVGQLMSLDRQMNH